MIKGTNTFEIKVEHLQLLKRAIVSWRDWEYGAPCIDFKRPYGKGDVEGDIAQILGWEYDKENGLTDEQSKIARTLHLETKQLYR